MVEAVNTKVTPSLHPQNITRIDGYSEETAAVLKPTEDPFGKHVQFPGFDGNNESEHMGVARFLIEKMGCFERFGGKRSLNSHSHSVEGCRRMLAVFEPIRAKLVGRHLSVDEIVEILNARRYPG
ncbi:hypothetical protein NOLU111490_17310 [Novosphingobium lubricantis]|jgi:hypothetical protein